MPLNQQKNKTNVQHKHKDLQQKNLLVLGVDKLIPCHCKPIARKQVKL